jgi:hypothetical protein
MTKGKFMETTEITTEIKPMGKGGAICYVPMPWVGKRVSIKMLGESE